MVWFAFFIPFFFFYPVIFGTLRQKNFKISLSVRDVFCAHFLMPARPVEINSENKELESSPSSGINYIFYPMLNKQHIRLCHSPQRYCYHTSMDEGK